MVDGRLVHEAMARPGRRRTDGAARQLCGSNRRRFAWDDRRQPFRCARALVNKPDVLLMDEPLANLDSLTRIAMQAELHALWQRERVTVFLVTHDVEEALYLAGRVVVLSQRPARVQADIKIDLPHPRHRGSVEFVELRRRVLEALGLQMHW